MKVYPDANIYVNFLLAEGQEEMAADCFQRGIGCAFSIIASRPLFSEVLKRCGERGTLLLQSHIDSFTKIRKLDMVAATDEERESAEEWNKRTGRVFGTNDFLHAILAARCADLFVSNDWRFRNTASHFVRTISLREFWKELEAHAR